MSKRFPAAYPGGTPLWPAEMPIAEIDLPEHGHVHQKDPIVDNTSRAGSAAVALKAFARTQGLDLTDGTNAYLHGEGPDTAIGDLLGNLRHLCDALGLEYDALNRAGEMHYNAEISGEDYA